MEAKEINYGCACSSVLHNYANESLQIKLPWHKYGGGGSYMGFKFPATKTLSNTVNINMLFIVSCSHLAVIANL